MIDPENRDRLTRIGGISSTALANPTDYEQIVRRCSEEFAIKLFARTVRSHRLLTMRESARNVVEGMARESLHHATEFLKVFVERRLRHSESGVVCDPRESPPIAQTAPQSYHPGTGLPDPVEGVFTTQPWPVETTHCEQFPHLVLLAQKEEPRVYTVLPMAAAFLKHEETAFEVARLFAAYAEVDLSLSLPRIDASTSGKTVNTGAQHIDRKAGRLLTGR